MANGEIDQLNAMQCKQINPINVNKFSFSAFVSRTFLINEINLSLIKDK